MATAALLAGCASGVEAGKIMPTEPFEHGIFPVEENYSPCTTTYDPADTPESFRNYTAERNAADCETIMRSGRVALVNVAGLDPEVVQALATTTEITLTETTHGAVNVSVDVVEPTERLRSEYNEFTSDGCINVETEDVPRTIGRLMPNTYQNYDFVIAANEVGGCEIDGTPLNYAGTYHGGKQINLYGIENRVPGPPVIEYLDESHTSRQITYPDDYPADAAGHEILHELGLGHASRLVHDSATGEGILNKTWADDTDPNIALSDIIKTGQIAEYGDPTSVMASPLIGYGYTDETRNLSYAINPIQTDMLQWPQNLAGERHSNQRLLATGEAAEIPAYGNQYVTIPLDSGYTALDAAQGDLTDVVSSLQYDRLAVGYDYGNLTLYMIDVINNGTLNLGVLPPRRATTIRLDDGRAVIVTPKEDYTVQIIVVPAA